MTGLNRRNILLSGLVLAIGLCAAMSQALWPGSLSLWAQGGASTRNIAARSGAGGPVAGERYAWKPVAIGGGGSVTGFAADPAGRTRIVRTDVYGAYLWREDRGRWEQLVTARAMPAEDRRQGGLAMGVYEVAVAPAAPDRLYMALGNRVYRSDDRGAHWTAPGTGPSFRFSPNGPYRFRGPFLAVSPDNPDRIVLGTETQGLWRSDDGAKSWSRIEAVPPSRADRNGKSSGMPVWIVRSGQQGRPPVIYAFSPGNGLWRSVDDGRTFAAADPSFSPRAPQEIARAAFSATGGFYAVSEREKGVYLLRDGAWRNFVAEGRVPAGDYVGLTISPTDGRIVVVDSGGGAFSSTDGGESWSGLGHRMRVGEGEPPWLRVNDLSYFATGSVAFAPVRPGRIWAMTGTGPYYADCDAGCASLLWTSHVRGIEELVASDVAQAPDRAPLFAALDFGIHLKEDLDRFSEGYGPTERVLIAAQQVAWTPADPDFLATNASDTRTFCCSNDGKAVMAGYSMDGGRSWRRFPSLPHPPGTEEKDPWRMAFGTIAVAADDPDNIIWAPGYDRAPFYTLDRGQTWRRVVFPGEQLPLTGSYPSIWIQRKTLAADRVLAKTFYFHHSGTRSNPGLAGVWRTADGGRSWQLLHAGELAPRSNSAAKLRAVPGHAGHLFFTSAQPDADAAPRRSVDGGKTWSRVPRVTQADDIAFGKAAPGQDYPAVYLSGKVDGRYGIWRSVDNLRHWQRIAEFPLDRLDQIVVMDADKSVFGRVYLGFMGSGWVYGEPASCEVKEAGGGQEQCIMVDGGR
ncbi:MAG: WD40/YVTN/BNR-like repeat-containing protein [Sphingobium sp.]